MTSNVWVTCNYHKCKYNSMTTLSYCRRKNITITPEGKCFLHGGNKRDIVQNLRKILNLKKNPQGGDYSMRHKQIYECSHYEIEVNNGYDERGETVQVLKCIHCERVRLD